MGNKNPKKIILEKLTKNLKEYLPNFPNNTIKKIAEDIMKKIDEIGYQTLGQENMPELYDLMSKLDDNKYKIIAATIISEIKPTIIDPQTGNISPALYNPKRIGDDSLYKIFETMAKYVLPLVKEK